jgi:hypothetical protein
MGDNILKLYLHNFIMNKPGMRGNHILTGTNANYEDEKIICYRNRVEIS